MLSSEKRSLVRFLAIYLSSTFILFFLATFIFYTFQKHQIIDSQNSKLLIKSEQIIQELRKLSSNYETKLHYPQYDSYDSAIYNLDKKLIFGTKKYQNIQWNKEYYQEKQQLFYLHPVEPYYLGTAHLIVSQEINQEPLDELFKMSSLFLLGASFIFSILGFF